MINDDRQKILDAWRKEFISLNKNKMDTRELAGDFYDPITAAMFQGFIMGKANQRVIDLPNPVTIDCSTLNNLLYIDYLSLYAIHEAITKAGYSYKLEGQ